jgi:hypothetical protein
MDLAVAVLHMGLKYCFCSHIRVDLFCISANRLNS